LSGLPPHAIIVTNNNIAGYLIAGAPYYFLVLPLLLVLADALALRWPRWLACRSAPPFWYPENALDCVPERADDVPAAVLGCAYPRDEAEAVAFAEGCAALCWGAADVVTGRAAVEVGRPVLTLVVRFTLAFAERFTFTLMFTLLYWGAYTFLGA
jgi:hypothetical protein